jgi:hypothetical protein
VEMWRQSGRIVGIKVAYAPQCSSQPDAACHSSGSDYLAPDLQRTQTGERVARGKEVHLIKRPVTLTEIASPLSRYFTKNAHFDKKLVILTDLWTT